MYEDITYQLANELYYNEQETDVPQCQEYGCDQSAIECVVELDQPKEYYCPYHAAEHGYCCCCGVFIAGWVDDYDMCDICKGQIESDNDDEMDYNEFNERY